MSTIQSVLKFVQIQLSPKSQQRDQHNNYSIDMNLGAVESCPLLNDYKQKLLWSRFPQSVLGGLRLRRIAVSAIIGQLFVFLLPFIVASISTFANYYSSQPFLLMNGTFGIALFLALTVLKTLPLPKTNKISQDLPTYRFSLEEESVISTNNFLTWENLTFLFPRHGHYLFRIIDPFCYALTFTLGCEVSRISYMRSVLQLQDEAYIPLFIFMWFSYLVGLYPLISNVPAEVATYKGHDTAGTDHLYRPCYLLGLSGTIFLLLIVYGDITTNQLKTMGPVEQQTVFTLYAILCFLPILFSAGLLPPLDCLFSWLPETWLVIFNGTSACTSLLGTLVQFVVTVTLAAVVHNVPHHNLTWLVATVSALLSCNVLALQRGVYKSLKFWMSLAFSTFISLTISITSPLLDIQTVKLEYTSLIVVAMSSLLIMIQNVYCFNLIRNPLFFAIDASKSIKWGFKLLNMTRFAVCPVVLSLYYNHLFKSYDSYTWFQTVLLGRAFREIWQNNQHCQAATSLFVIIRLSNPTTSLSSDSAHLTDTDPITSLWLCSVFVYFLKKGLRRLHLCFKLQFDFVALKKQRRKETRLITAANVIFLPVVICVAMVTAGLNIPLLPLFTLPVFCISFPRPTKFWPDASTSYSSSRDAAFYKQVTPHYLSALASDVKHNLTCGSFFVSRVENLLIFSHVLESGFGYASLLMKGLELQETSCHTEEVNVVKDIFDGTFEGTKCYNDFFMHMLQPLSKTSVLTYSDAKNVLTGVLDSPTCLERLAGNFRKCLTYFLCTQYPKCGESIQYEGTVLVSNKATKTTTSTAKGAAPSTARGGFDFTGLHNKATTGVGDVLEDASSTATLVSKNRSEDFLDNLSFNCSEESWFEQVLVNKTTHSPVKSEDNEIKPKSIRGGESESCKELDRDSNNFIDEEERIVLEEKECNGSGKGAGLGGEERGVPEDWLKVPFCREEVEKECENFPLDLFRSKSSVHVGHETVSGLVSSAYLALRNSSSGVNKSANQVVKTYGGNVYFGKCKQWIEDNSELKRLLITSYRFAVKLSIDETVFGDNETLEEYFDSMLALERDWYIGLETDPAWQKSLEESKQFVFTLGFNKEGVYASRTLSLTKLPMLTGQLNSENVRSIWSALSLELLYLTNDDEERYSIQAHPNILRNIVTQSADLPLGYPVYSSGVQHVSTL